MSLRVSESLRACRASCASRPPSQALSIHTPGPAPGCVCLGYYSPSRLDSESPFFFATLHENPAPLRQAAAAADAARGGSVRSSALLKVAAVT